MLEFLTEKISLMNDKDKRNIVRLIDRFNKNIRQVDEIQNPKFNMYVLDLMHKDYNDKIDKFIADKYDDIIIGSKKLRKS